MQRLRHKYNMKREMHLHLYPSPWQLDTDITLSVGVTYNQSNTLFHLAALKWHISWIPVHEKCNYNRSPTFQMHVVDTDLSTLWNSRMDSVKHW